MLLRPLQAVIVLALLGASPAAADDPPCPGLFAEGRAPVLTNPKLAAHTRPLCFEAYAVLHSGASRTPLYAAEHLTRESVAAARMVARDDSFHEEERLPAAERSQLEDYVHSGFDRGHLAPAGDMPTPEAQAQSFSLANIVPQNRAFNRGLWSGIEESVRRLASQRGTLYVVTGAVFTGGVVDALKSRVLVPTQLYKALYDPASGEAGAYLAPNRGGGEWRAVSMDELRAVAGVDVFPGLPAAAKARAMDLPEPREFARGDAAERRPRSDTWQDWFFRELARAVSKALRDVLRSIF
ncbi:DNA/RNA non-specific endonuclease [Methylobacterium symbioticum]|uniref:Endonuclease n=1 Tax=Methylobacterium symbioticum TaxID=2584084 RepID=A0A509EMC6_9HYPH|nr:DNA/RNA non-specific endonuclease [Methylobacterium symbioticum]VUD74649.1 Nuclease [Methylobacterium symbioticum]